MRFPSITTRVVASDPVIMQLGTQRTALLICLATALGCSDTPVQPASPDPFVSFSAEAGANWGPWSAPVHLGAVNSSAQENQAALSPDNLSLYFSSSRPGGLGGDDIWVARRASLESPWEAPENLGPLVNSAGHDRSPAFSVDGHLLFFHSDRPGGYGLGDIYMSRRQQTHDDFGWGSPIILGTRVNTSANDASPMYLQQVEDGPVNLYFARGPDGVTLDIYAASVTRDGETNAPALPVPELNVAVTGVTDAHPTVSRDGMELLFYSNRPGGVGDTDLYVATRRSIHSSWSTPRNLGPTVNTPFRDNSPTISFDGSTLVFSSNRPGGLGASDLWMSTRTKNGR